jgi:uroporphyrin-III C-methyltransferase/precorrin-2 dehydrogenase/sirohydrochlorin ferrochelatase
VSILILLNIIVSNASRANQEVKISTLENLIVDSKDMQRPAILVFGDVVRLNDILNNGD